MCKCVWVCGCVGEYVCVWVGVCVCVWVCGWMGMCKCVGVGVWVCVVHNSYVPPIEHRSSKGSGDCNWMLPLATRLLLYHLHPFPVTIIGC